MLGLNIYTDENYTEPVETLTLGTAILEDGVSGYSKPMPIWARNEGDTTLVAANVNMEGAGADLIQLARDENGQHGIWAQPGEGIVALANTVEPGDSFVFWARAAFTEEDAPERKHFQFTIELVGRN